MTGTKCVYLKLGGSEQGCQLLAGYIIGLIHSCAVVGCLAAHQLTLSPSINICLLRQLHSGQQHVQGHLAAVITP